MSTFEERLDRIVLDLKQGMPVPPVIIRKFMEWADVERRTRWNVDYIDKNLACRKLVTVPNYKDVWVDNPIVFQLDESNSGGSTAQKPEMERVVLEDPTFKIGDLPSARQAPLFVPPDASLATAVTLMMGNDYSQLPVGYSLSEITHVISWKSIASRIVNGSKAGIVRDLSDTSHEVFSSSSIFGVVKTIAEHDYVLVKSIDNGEICGIVTGSDLSIRFEEISTPFLLISEIEIHIRNRIENMLPQNVAAPGAESESASNNRKRTFYDYVEILKKEENWTKLSLYIDRETFCRELDWVRKIRNNVMHFSKDAPQSEEVRRLRSIAKMLEFLRVV